MATTENEVLLIAKDADGNLYLVYPATKASQVDGLDELLALKADKKTLLELTPPRSTPAWTTTKTPERSGSTQA